MIKLATWTSLALLLTAGFASAQNAMTSGPPSTVLTPDQCNEIWNKAVTKGDTPDTVNVAQVAEGDTPDIASFAQVDDFAQVDPNNDGTVTKEEFEAACRKGLVHEPLRVKE
jgi:hypothetical protein